MECTKDEPLFSDAESEDEDEDGDRGAIYSGSRGVASHLFNAADFAMETPERFDTRYLSDLIIPDETLDNVRNAIDARDERGVRNNRYVSYL